MDILKMLASLRAEREQIVEAIVAIERLAVGTRGKRRGRPPKWLAGADKAVNKAVENKIGESAAPAPKRTMSAAARKKMADAQKKRWAAKKALASQTGSKA